MKILVTGGAGFIGSNFVRYWNRTNPSDSIVVLDKLTYAGHKENLLGVNNVNLVQGDICDPETVREVMHGVTAVVHFAAESHVDRSIIEPSIFLKTNVLGTQVLLEEARLARVSLFHHVSTDEVFGSLKLEDFGSRFTESTPYNPHSPYSASKAGSDHMVRAWHDTYGLPVTISNTSNNYGPYHDLEKLIPRFTTKLLVGEKLPLMGKGENVRDWCYVLDHCEAIGTIVNAALQDSSIIGETFCVGGNSERSNLQVTQELLRLFGRDESWIEPIEHRLGHDARYSIDSSKIRDTLGWKPKHQFEEWLAETVDWYRKNEWWWRPLQEGRPIVDPEVQRQMLRGKER